MSSAICFDLDQSKILSSGNVLTPFSTVFQLYLGDQCTYPCFPGFLLTSTIFFPSHWLLSHISIVETTNSGERGINPVTMIMINPLKEYWPSRGSNQRPPVLKSATLPSELWGSADFIWRKGLRTA